MKTALGSHKTRPVLDIAARWYIAHGHRRRRAVVPTLRNKFGLSNLEAIQVLTVARDMAPGGENDSCS